LVDASLVRAAIDIAMFFGLYVTIAMALNFQYGNAGVPNMGSAVSVAFGAYVVSGICLRLMYVIGMKAGIEIGPDYVYDNLVNVANMNTYFSKHPLLGIALFLFAMTMGLVLGTLFGYVVSLPAIRLRSTYLMITMIAMSEASQIIGRNYVPISGGTLGVRIPNVFAFYSGDRSLLLAIITLAVGLVSFFVFKNMLNSPYGRLMRSLRENEVTLNSVGKNAIGIRRNILMFSSGITSLIGVLLVFYFSFSTATNYTMSNFTYWPWLMLMVGGPGNNTGTFLGAFLVIAMRRLITIYKWEINQFFWFPIAFLEQVILGVVLLVILMFKPEGLIPEKALHIRGIDYNKIIEEDIRIDWKQEKKRAGESKQGIMDKIKSVIKITHKN
jgi:branched-chain amino acid transport system permease protein